MTRAEREKLLRDYSQRGVRDLAEVLVQAEEAMEKRQKAARAEAGKLRAALAVLADAAETFAGSDPRISPDGYREDADALDRAIDAARKVLS